MSTVLIQKGLFTLKSGEISKFYIDIRKAMSFHLLIESIGEKIFSKINEIIILKIQNVS